MPTAPLQSPIDIAAPLTRDDLPPLDFRYPAAAIAVFDRLAALDLAALLPPPGRRASYRYEGSLTTADDDGVFRDGVQWIILRQPVTAAPAQIDAHRAFVDAPLPDLDRPNPPGNARPLQPRGGRRIVTER